MRVRRFRALQGGTTVAISSKRIRFTAGTGEPDPRKALRFACCLPNCPTNQKQKQPDQPRDDGKRFVVHSDEKLTAFLGLERVTRESLHFLIETHEHAGDLKEW
jgi:hypothetical protein